MDSNFKTLFLGDERKWFAPSVLLYILAASPPIWLLELTMCDWRNLASWHPLG